jgi:Tfp pilus assembly protein PilO
MSFSFFKNQALKNKILANIILLLLIVGGGVYFIIMPATFDIEKMNNEIIMQMVDLELKYQRGQNLKKLKETLKKIEPELDKLDKVLIKRTKALEFITSLEEIAERNNVTQKINLVIDQNKKIKENQKTPLQLAVTCEFNKCYDYLSALEKSNYYINIKSLEFTSSGKIENGPSMINLLVFADTYWR